MKIEQENTMHSHNDKTQSRGLYDRHRVATGKTGDQAPALHSGVFSRIKTLFTHVQTMMMEATSHIIT